MYIVAIMITAIIFSATGLGVLNLAQLVNVDTQKAVQSLEDQMELESSTNLALWRLNAGADSLATYTEGDFSSTYDSVGLQLTLSLTTADGDEGFVLQMEEDDHFEHAIATSEYFHSGSRTIGEEAEHEPRETFGFLPTADLTFWYSVADSVYTDNSKTYHDGDLPEGILIFEGNNIQFQDITLTGSTMIFTGYGIDFWKTNRVTAYSDGSNIYPALVFTDTTTFWINEFFFNRQDYIKGAIVSHGDIVLRKGELTGPVIARNVFLYRNMNFIDDQYPQYYTWPMGFGAYDEYDWPKQIALWQELNN